MAHDPIALRARYVFPVVSPPIRDGVVTLFGDSVLDVSPSGLPHLQNAIIDLGNVALLPGFCNAHTHLEFSKLAAPAGTQGMPFVDWVRQVIALRREQPTLFEGAVEQGIAESTRCGVSELVDIAQSAPSPTLASTPLDLTSLR
ncbi:MAG TPA: hypothetical protein VNQ74_14120, partial [Burkholderiaceae bacterium]|nr:hypothetical protein [Burkholderiaceae bacterium]